MNNADRKIHIVGGGIAGLAAAVIAIRDGKARRENISIYEEGRDPDAESGGNIVGGALDATKIKNKGYVMRGGRMFEAKYLCTYDLLSEIPDLDNPAISAKQDIKDFSAKFWWNSTARLVDDKCAVLPVKSMGFDMGDRMALLRLLFTCETELKNKRIDEVFPKHFFHTNFWLMWCAMFSFQPWHSASEMRRYLKRFIHLFPQIASLRCVEHTRYNQYDSMVRPIINWLNRDLAEGEQGVFRKGVCVEDIEFESTAPGKFRVARLKTRRRGEDGLHDIEMNDGDIVLVTNGSMTDGATLGDGNNAAPLKTATGGAWKLWKSMAQKFPGAFGDPDVFLANVDQSKWVSFTVSTRSKKFADRLFELTGQIFGREGLVTFKESGWLLTTHAHFSPVSPAHKEREEWVFWGYGLRPDGVGDYVKKKMADCSGGELLEETLRQYQFDDEVIREIMDPKVTDVVPCMMPWITSQFMPRELGDRAPVRPKAFENLAFIGQFAEADKDVVFTVEYSVRTAKIALRALLDPAIRVEEMYEANLLEKAKAVWISMRPAWWPL